MFGSHLTAQLSSKQWFFTISAGYISKGCHQCKCWFWNDGACKMHKLFAIHQMGLCAVQDSHTDFSYSFFRITDFNFNNRRDHKTAGRRAWLHHRWWWNPTLAFRIYLCLTAAKRRLILQLVAQAAHEPVCDSPVEPCRICYKFKFRDGLFLTQKPVPVWLWQKQELLDAVVTAWLVSGRFSTLTLHKCWAANVLKGWLTEEELIKSPGLFTLI